MRASFIGDMNHHVKHKSHKFLLKTENPAASKTIISEFLKKYGRIYWGNNKREHLEEPDISKGFLCPRDATRGDSRWAYHPVLDYANLH